MEGEVSFRNHRPLLRAKMARLVHAKRGNQMTEGTVVMVLGNLDTRIREANALAVGTVVFLAGDQSWVLLQDGNFWIGSRRMIRQYNPAELGLQ